MWIYSKACSHLVTTYKIDFATVLETQSQHRKHQSYALWFWFDSILLLLRRTFRVNVNKMLVVIESLYIMTDSFYFFDMLTPIPSETLNISTSYINGKNSVQKSNRPCNTSISSSIRLLKYFTSNCEVLLSSISKNNLLLQWLYIEISM